MRVYVAGASAEMERARRAMDAIRAAGHEITFDWIARIEEAGCASPTDQRTRLRSAERDLEGIRGCGVFWLLAPALPSTGVWVEMGYALSLKAMRRGFRIVISGDSARCIFAALGEEYATDDEALAAILKGEEARVRAPIACQNPTINGSRCRDSCGSSGCAREEAT